jgi:hypothetical protein
LSFAFLLSARVARTRQQNLAPPRFGQDDAGGALGHVGRGTDGDAHFCLAEGGRIVDPVACHAGDMPSGLQVLHDDVFVFGIHFGEPIGARQQVNRLVAGLCAWSPQASAMVRTAPFITRSRFPFCSITASVRAELVAFLKLMACTVRARSIDLGSRESFSSRVALTKRRVMAESPLTRTK